MGNKNKRIQYKNKALDVSIVPRIRRTIKNKGSNEKISTQPKLKSNTSAALEYLAWIPVLELMGVIWIL